MNKVNLILFLAIAVSGCSVLPKDKTKKLMEDHLIIEPLPMDDQAMYKEFEDKLSDNGFNSKILGLGKSQEEQLIILRNDTIDRLLALSDAKYSDFRTYTSAENSTFETLVGVASIGMTAAATLAGGPIATTLAATDTALKGAHATVNEKWIQNKTVSAIIAAIDTVRNEVQQKIEKGKKQSYLDYTMREAIGDINKRHNAASIINGLMYLESISKNQQAASQVSLEKEKNTGSNADKTKETIASDLDAAAKSALLNAIQSSENLGKLASDAKIGNKKIVAEVESVTKAVKNAQVATELSNSVLPSSQILIQEVGPVTSGGISP